MTSKEALVVAREILFEGGEFQGFLPLGRREFLSLIKEKHTYHLRGSELEENKSFKQIIPYVWIVKPESREVFLYKRALNENKEEGDYKEKRYLNNFSGGVGGHIDRDTEEGSDDPINQAMMRELREEVEMSEYAEPKIIGHINDDSNELGAVHFGVVAIVETKGDVKLREGEGGVEGRFYSLSEAEDLLENPENEVENWTRISWEYVKSYLNSV